MRQRLPLVRRPKITLLRGGISPPLGSGLTLPPINQAVLPLVATAQPMLGFMQYLHHGDVYPCACCERREHHLDLPTSLLQDLKSMLGGRTYQGGHFLFPVTHRWLLAPDSSPALTFPSPNFPSIASSPFLLCGLAPFAEHLLKTQQITRLH